MKIKFWGVRGSTPTPERRNSRYGGNTPCIEVRLANGTLIVLDCGTGLRSLGKGLMREFGERPIHGYVFLTHFHWDHIQGIPFFPPFYKAGNIFLFHSVKREGADIQAVIEDQMANPYFPVNMKEMASTRHFFNLDQRPINLSGAVIRSIPLNHPQGCVAYRIDADGGSIVLATDTEPGSPHHDRALREFVRGANVMVYDAQFTPEQLANEKKGWGHSSWLEGVRIAREADVGKLILFHHDPDSNDAYVDGLVAKASRELPGTVAAAEGLEILLPEGKLLQGRVGRASERRRDRRYPIELPVRLLWHDAAGRAAEAEALSKDVSRSGIRMVSATPIPSDRPLELELILPDEITHRGEVVFRFVAHPVRREQANGELGGPGFRMGLAARLYPPEESPGSPEPLLAAHAETKK
jgi:phosphoribosyl 1,2-cyclic phosphodiesterase